MLTAMTRVNRLLVVAGAAAVLAGTTFALQAQDVPESVMSCVATGSKVGHTWIQHADPARLKEAVRIYETKAESVDYPEGTVLRLIPQEAMIKRSKAAFPNTNGWEYFALAVTPQGTTVRARGNEASNPLGTCQNCHSGASKGDYICASGGCTAVPLTEERIAAIQTADPRGAQ